MENMIFEGIRRKKTTGIALSRAAPLGRSQHNDFKDTVKRDFWL
jgi:hypothetical protein